ncbi:MAG: Pyruvate dehydrogenase complex repressor [Candidatus Accumulibacter phosphatis]|jgi:GntR family transcriptional repressor for pyruvate dehydrogenase complex|uniref:Pyruvate dehydrogenase complex repressor n=1 Tax=Candidatus Accumulibacter phosphatis TaxID=327160 RepID=A0A080LUT6_9PROT|nr:FCD domain-containing protein [Accumulibacter sp.]KFB71415.1 MAG: Pyruvate dehydrogenase complex repressor [Candidatus Accumulibacter phosphatis]MBL8396217.1 FCD domain-containing protein [Accumulibacter sp.]
MTYSKLNLPRIPDAIAHQLETRIIEGSLKPGDRLPAERELALELGVSRPSLREAIKQLVSRQLLVSRHGGGTYVTDRLATSFSDPWQQLIDQHPFLQDDMLEFRHLLEASAAELAAQRATEADLQRLEQAYTRLDLAYQGEDRSIQVAAEVAFHLTIAESAHNALFGHLMSSLLRLLHEHVRRSLRDLSVSPESGQQLMRQHQAIRDAIVNRQADAARLAAQTHINYVRQRISEASRSEKRQQRSLRHLS